MTSRALPRKGPLTEQAAELWQDQQHDWPMLRDGAARLAQAEVRSIVVAGRTLRLQHNPGRAVSATARVDAAAIAARRCFLCGPHLPPEQRAVALDPDWWLLCNPAPIFAPHFVSAATRHVPQRVEPAIPALLHLARDLDGEYVAFYNGPGAGASAPDHLHLQAVPAAKLPCVPHVAADADWQSAGSLAIGFSRLADWPALIFRGDDAVDLDRAVRRAVAAFAETVPEAPEPRLNLYALWQGSAWQVWFVPRRAHRPQRYGTGPGQLLVSPGAIELAGVVVTPRAEDFAGLTSRDVLQVYSDVHVTPDQFARLRDRLTS